VVEDKSLVWREKDAVIPVVPGEHCGEGHCFKRKKKFITSKIKVPRLGRELKIIRFS
jgi:hypothetical protein